MGEGGNGGQGSLYTFRSRIILWGENGAGLEGEGRQMEESLDRRPFVGTGIA